MLAEVLKGLLSPTGKYFAFCNNIDLLSKYQVEIDGITFNVLPDRRSETGSHELLELSILGQKLAEAPLDGGKD